ncbi:hypothetical protein IJG89_01855 [Candidatus Saccharibacteria bacterium]|nr:hypothetical protein [Candidatus Saccharibacteria bacterium]
MSVFASVEILILAMLIVSLLQLTPGIFLLFSHFALGKYSRRKASNLSLFFIFGAEIFIAAVFISLYYILYALNSTPIDFNCDLIAWISAGVLTAIGTLFPMCYFRKGAGTKLFIPRSFATKISDRALTSKSRSDAFVLGFISGVPELIFTIPLYIVAILEIMRVGETPIIRGALVLAFVLITITSLMIYHIKFSLGYNLAEFERARVRNKNFTRFFLSLLYILTAIIIITFRIIIK